MKKSLIGLGACAAFMCQSTGMAAYTIEAEPNDTAGTAQSLDPFFSFGPNTVIEIDAAGNLAEVSASVIGFGGDSTVDWYSFTVGTAGSGSPLEVGRTVYFDTDFADATEIDTVLELYDTDGLSFLASNDDSAFDGPGDLIALTHNSFLAYDFSSAGTYFVQVNEWGESGLVSDGSYHLHVSSVPVPAAVWLFGSGLLAMAGLRRRQS